MDSDDTRRAVRDGLARYAAAYPHIKITPGLVEVWYQLLADLPAEAVDAAFVAVLKSREVATLPAVGVIRRVAEEIAGRRISPSKAWKLVADPRRWLYNRHGDVVGLRAEGLTEAVLEAAHRFGVENLSEDHSRHAYREFRAIYEEVLAEQGEAEALEALKPGRQLLPRAGQQEEAKDEI